MTGLTVAGLAAGAAAGGGAVRYRDIASARTRADGATVAERSAATSVRVMWRANTSDKVMALSFDDGPGTSLTAPLLDVLRDEQVRATFCLVGRRAFERRELVVRQMRDGHELVNHTWSHADLSLLEYDAAKQELERTDQLLSEITGRAPRLIRPPYGRIDGALLQYAARAHQHILLWDLRFHEAQFDPAGNVEYVLENMRPGSVLLGHDAGSKDRYVGIRAVPEVIREAKRRGYEFLTASEMFARDSEQELRQPPSP